MIYKILTLSVLLPFVVSATEVQSSPSAATNVEVKFNPFDPDHSINTKEEVYEHEEEGTTPQGAQTAEDDSTSS
ncbi:MAG: hypothetical protein WCG04_02080 [Alphaproteobacteria bacterium]